jgi:DNA-binding transcriptional MerR regulator
MKYLRRRKWLDFECTRSGRLDGVDVQMIEQSLSVSEAAERVGLTTYTLRWYEQEGLLDPVGRDAAGRRRYTEADVSWLVLLTRLRRTGMPVRDMRRYADLARQGEATVGARRRLFEQHRERVLARIAALHEDLQVLDYKIKLYTEMERNP